jgi:restriction endonuclease Mrr
VQKTCIFIVTIGLLATALSGQQRPTTSLTPIQLAAFDHFFKILGDPSQTSVTLQLRERDAVLMYGLSQAETVTLHALSQQYLTAASQFNQGVQSIAANKTVMSNSDRASLESLNVQRQQVVATLATALLQQLSPASSAKFLLIIDKGRP